MIWDLSTDAHDGNSLLSAIDQAKWWGTMSHEEMLTMVAANQANATQAIVQ
jgi:hypothetical protein